MATCLVCSPGGEIFHFSGFVKCQIKQTAQNKVTSVFYLEVYNAYIIAFLLLSIPKKSKSFKEVCSQGCFILYWDSSCVTLLQKKVSLEEIK